MPFYSDFILALLELGNGTLMVFSCFSQRSFITFVRVLLLQWLIYNLICVCERLVLSCWLVVGRCAFTVQIFWLGDVMIFESKVNAETITKVNATGIAEPIPSTSLHDLQVYGIIVTIIICFIVFGGVKIINRVAPAFLIPVLLSIFCIFIGIAAAKKDHPASECVIPILFISFLSKPQNCIC